MARSTLVTRMEQTIKKNTHLFHTPNISMIFLTDLREEEGEREREYIERNIDLPFHLFLFIS